MTQGTFAFRMPQEVKAAAEALSKTWPNLSKTWLRKVDPEGTEGIVFGGSINQTLNLLVMRGLEKTAEFVDVQFQRTAQDYKHWEQLMQFFLNNPATRRALPASFDPETAAHKYLVLENSPEGVDRLFVADEFAISQRCLLFLNEAKAAIQRALASVSDESDEGQEESEIEIETKATRRGGRKPTHADDMVIRLKVEKSPKTPGNKNFERYAKMKDGMTVAQALQAGVTRGDLKYDEDHNYIEIVPAMAAAGGG